MSAISYKCPHCGGDLRFEPEGQKYKCEYCLSDFSLEELEEANPQAEEKAQEETGTGEAMVYSCPSCGAEVVTDETTAATFCYYCHNPVVLKGRLNGTYLPDRVIPFQITREQAEQKFMEQLGKKKFVPTAFFQKKQVEKISGVYFPYWVCEEELSGKMRATATNVRVWRGGDIEYTETRFYEVEREGDIQMKELSRNALKEANRKLVEGVQPFPMEKSQPFSMGYLSGFQAQRRNLERADLSGEIQQEAKGYAEKLLRDTISGYTSVTPKHTSFTVEKEQWSYLLLPVWSLTYKGKDGKFYYYAMNGATGNVYGELPVDYKKVALLFAAVFVPVLLLCLIGGYFL